ncbi:MAG: hypothetical protein LBG60_10765 [Bifidobacteriaceae bacterium]|jgi:hypothetical protein|nr:hypothetical protein [Bifidobacteriaceae bacterium]
MASSDEVTAHVAREVAAAIARADRSCAWVAKTTGIPNTTLGRKLRGHVPFNMVELASIAEALGVPASRFVPPSFIVAAPPPLGRAA